MCHEVLLKQMLGEEMLLAPAVPLDLSLNDKKDPLLYKELFQTLWMLSETG